MAPPNSSPTDWRRTPKASSTALKPETLFVTSGEHVKISSLKRAIQIRGGGAASAG